MSSIFATSTGKRNTPSWCKAGMYTGIDPMVDGRPANLNAYARWTGYDSAGPYNIIETIRLTRNSADNGWYGTSWISGDNLAIDVMDTASETLVDVHLTRRRDTQEMETATWPLTPTTFRMPWGTKQLTTPPDAYDVTIDVQILA